MQSYLAISTPLVPKDCVLIQDVLIATRVNFGKRPFGDQQCCAYSQTVCCQKEVCERTTIHSSDKTQNSIGEAEHSNTVNNCTCFADDDGVQTLDLWMTPPLSQELARIPNRCASPFQDPGQQEWALQQKPCCPPG